MDWIGFSLSSRVSLFPPKFEPSFVLRSDWGIYGEPRKPFLKIYTHKQSINDPYENPQGKSKREISARPVTFYNSGGRIITGRWWEGEKKDSISVPSSKPKLARCLCITCRQANTITTIHRLHAKTVYKMQTTSPLREATSSQAANTQVDYQNILSPELLPRWVLHKGQWVSQLAGVESKKYLNEFSEIYLPWLDKSWLLANCVSTGIIQWEICRLKCVGIIFCWISCGLSVCK